MILEQGEVRYGEYNVRTQETKRNRLNINDIFIRPSSYCWPG